MARIRRHLLSTVFALGFAGSSLLISACHDRFPSGPDPTAARPSPALDLGSLDLTNILTYVSLPDLTKPRHTEARIRADSGGVVELAGVRLEVPAGALAQDTTITLDLPTDPTTALYLVVDFGPDGLEFLKPATIRFDLGGVDLTGVDLTTVRVSYWDGLGWQGLSSEITPDTAALLGLTTHFTGFGAESPSGG